MKRVIKFRAWDESRSQMITQFGRLTENNPELIQTEDLDIICGHYQENGDWIEPKLMQFTGLHDRNGVEIYEGDILKWKCSKSGSTKVKEHIVTIELDSHHYSLTIYDNKEKWATQRSFWNAMDREVIGNIYEHPQLLNNQ